MANNFRQQSIFWTVFVIFAIAAGWSGHYHFFGKGYFRPVLVTQDKINFGTVSTGQRAERELSVTNAGFRPLRIASVRSSCSGCIEIVSYPQTPIYRNETVAVRIALKTKGLSGQVRKYMMITSNDPRRPFCPVLIDAIVEREKERAVGNDN